MLLLSPLRSSTAKRRIGSLVNKKAMSGRIAPHLRGNLAALRRVLPASPPGKELYR
jgi:hypothetical protein